MKQIEHYTDNSNYPDSYYAASKNKKPNRPILKESIETDIAIVGGGFSGLSAGIHLTETGHKVVILEGAQIGWGASGRNGGQIVNGLNASLDTVKSRYGAEQARFIGGLLQDGGKIIRRLINDYQIDCDLKKRNIYVAFNPKQLQSLEDKKKLWESYGMNDHEMLDKQALKQHINSEAYHGGMLDHSGGHLHPLNLALGEAAAIEKNGGIIYENTLVTDIKYTANEAIVTTEFAEVKCKKVLLCGNAYLNKVIPELVDRIMPVSTQIIATEPLGKNTASSILPTDACIEDVRYILDYYRLSADNRLLFGGGVVYGGQDPKDIESKIRPNMEKIFPQLKGIAIDYAWGGNFALSFSRVPQIGKLHDRVLFAHGYSGHGVTGSHLFGKILSDAVNGNTSQFEQFEKIPWIGFPGGRQFRVPYSVAGSLWYSFRDKLGI